MTFFKFAAVVNSRIENEGVVNQYVCMFFYVISVLQCVYVLQENNGHELWSYLKYVCPYTFAGDLSLFIHFGLLIVFLVALVIFLILIGIKKKQNNLKKKLTNFQILLCKIINMKLLMFRTVLVMPLIGSIFQAINGQNHALSIVCLSIYFGLLFPISTFKFLNCIQIFKAITYPFFFNLTLIYHLYLPILGILSQTSQHNKWIVSLIFLCLSGISLYLYPVLTFKRNKFFVAVLSSVMWMSACSILQQLIVSSINPLIQVIILPIVILSGIKLDDVLINFRLKSNQKDLKRLKIFSFCLLNKQDYIFQLQTFVKIHKDSCKSIECVCKRQSQNDENSQNQKDDQKFYKSVYEILIAEIRYHYFQRTFFSTNNRKKSNQMQQFCICISEIQLKIFKRLRKAYISLNQFLNFEQKQNQIQQSFKFLTLYQIIKEQIQKQIEIQSKIQKNQFNLPAANYFSYETKLKKYKNYIKESVKNREFIWDQLKHNQPFNQMVTDSIQRNLIYHHKIQKLFTNFIDQYPEAITQLFELTNLYCQIILNQDQTQNQSILKVLRMKFKQYQSKISQSELKFSQNNKMFDTLSKTAVCLMKADFDNFGQISNTNFHFENSFFQVDSKQSKQSKKAQKAQKAQKLQKLLKKHTIFDLIIPELREIHKIWINQSVNGNKTNYNHQKTFVLTKDQTIQRENIFIQFRSSISGGLECQVFISRKEQPIQMYLIINAQLQIKGQSKNFKNLKEQMLQQKNIKQFFTSKSLQVLKKYEDQSSIQTHFQLKFYNQDYMVQISKKIKIPNNSLYELKIISKEKFSQTNINPIMLMTNEILNVEKFVHSTALQTFKMQQELKLITQKTDEEVQLDKTYEIAMQRKQSEIKKNWLKFSYLISILIIINICFVIFIVQNKKAVYDDGMSLIKNYNEMRVAITQILFDMQTLKVYAFLNQTDAALSSLERIKTSNKKIKNLLPQLVPYLNEEWLGYKAHESGQITNFNQNQYVIISNNLLSETTFITNQNISDLSFSFLYSRIGFPLNDIKIRYQQIYYNGYYTALGRLKQQKKQIDQLLRLEITSIKYQYLYITAICGFILCFVYVLVSFKIQKKIAQILAQNFHIMQRINMKLIKQKIRSIKLLKKSQAFSKILNNVKNTSIQNAGIISTTIYMLQPEQQPYNNTQRQFLNQNWQEEQVSSQNNFNSEENHTTSEKLTKSGYNEDGQPIINNQISYSNFDLQDEKKHSRFRIIRKNQRVKLKFILLISLFVIFFVITSIEQCIFSFSFYDILQVHSTLYERKVNLVSTCMTSLITPTLQIPQFNFFQYQLPVIAEIYRVQRAVYENALNYPNSQYSNLLDQFSNANICNYLQLFSKSDIYSITFSKDQCQNFIESQPFSRGFKASFVYYVEQSLKLLKTNAIPGQMTYDQRISYYQQEQVKQQIVFSAYLNQIADIVHTAFYADTSSIASQYTTTMHYLSAIFILLALSLIFFIKHRIKRLNKSLMILKSIYILISYKTFKENKLLGNSSIIQNMRFLE